MRIDKIIYDGVPIRIVRDDLFPFLGGGNKGRKMERIASDVLIQQCDALVTTGGVQSNHCRAVALKAAEMGWRCKLVLHGESERFYRESGNSRIIKLLGADVKFVDSSGIKESMDAAMDEFIVDGYKPYYIYGGGHTLLGGKAYVDAVMELKEYCLNENWFPEYIFLASGTGSTQSGIMAGLDHSMMKGQVRGISIARSKDPASKIVSEFYTMLKSGVDLKRETIIYDEYLEGGYEKYNESILDLIHQLARTTGILMDTTYTGKAFWGMLNVIKKEDLKGNVLFWHTGGINNLMAINI